MISSISSQNQGLPVRPPRPSLGDRQPTDSRIEATREADTFPRRPHQGPNAAFIAQLMGQDESEATHVGRAAAVRAYGRQDRQSLFGPDIEILPLELKLMDRIV